MVSESRRMEMNSTKYLNHGDVRATLTKLAEVTESRNGIMLH